MQYCATDNLPSKTNRKQDFPKWLKPDDFNLIKDFFELEQLEMILTPIRRNFYSNKLKRFINSLSSKEKIYWISKFDSRHEQRMIGNHQLIKMELRLVESLITEEIDFETHDFTDEVQMIKSKHLDIFFESNLSSNLLSSSLPGVSIRYEILQTLSAKKRN